MPARTLAVQDSMTIGPGPTCGGMLCPVTEFRAAETYHGEDGGLYGMGRNNPPRRHLAAAVHAAERVRALNVDGEPDPRGLIGFLSIGFSNTFHEFRDFAGLVRHESGVSPIVRPVNGAQMHVGSAAWAAAANLTDARHHGDPWTTLDERIEQAGVAAKQIQAAWVKLTPSDPGSLGAFPSHAQALTTDLRVIVQRLKRRFPNLQLAFLSSRIFAGFARTLLSPEPYAYESAFGVRWLIQEQIRGDAEVNWDPVKGPVSAPLLLWGPYLWTRGGDAMASGDLVWTSGDFVDDGTHPNAAGIRKVAHRLLTFMKTNPAARPWFLGG